MRKHNPTNEKETLIQAERAVHLHKIINCWQKRALSQEQIALHIAALEKNPTNKRAKHLLKQVQIWYDHHTPFIGSFLEIESDKNASLRNQCNIPQARYWKERAHVTVLANENLAALKLNPYDAELSQALADNLRRLKELKASHDQYLEICYKTTPGAEPALLKIAMKKATDAQKTIAKRLLEALSTVNTDESPLQAVAKANEDYEKAHTVAKADFLEIVIGTPAAIQARQFAKLKKSFDGALAKAIAEAFASPQTSKETSTLIAGQSKQAHLLHKRVLANAKAKETRRKTKAQKILDKAAAEEDKNTPTNNFCGIFTLVFFFPTSTLNTLVSSPQSLAYFGMGLYLILAGAICSLLATAAYLFSLSAVQDSEKRSEYECGFEPFDSATRLPFDVHFYLVGILFLIFDVEVALIFPWAVSLNLVGWFGFYLMMGFIVLLAVGFLYEWKRGALIWPSRQHEAAYLPSAALVVADDALKALPKTTPDVELLVNDFYSVSTARTDSADETDAILDSVLDKHYGSFENFYAEIYKAASEPQRPEMLDSYLYEHRSLLDNLAAEVFEPVLEAESQHALVDNVLTSVYGNFSDLAPEFMIVFSVLYVLVVLALELAAGRSKKLLALEALKALQITLMAALIMYTASLVFSPAIIILDGLFHTNAYVLGLKILTLICGLVIMHNSEAYLIAHTKHLLEFPILLTQAILFMLLMIGSTHLISAFLALVGFSLNLYVLILFDASTHAAREAGVKYYYLSTFSSGLMIYGIFLVYLILNTGNFSEIALILSSEAMIIGENAGLLHVAITMLLVGFAFKLSAVPGNLWAPEVYEGSSSAMMAFFMLPVKVAVFALLVQLLTVAFAPVVALWQPLIAFAAAASLVWGCFGAFYEKRTKRFFAYASINQIGFLLLGLATGSFEGYRSALLYLFIYAVTNVGFLLIFLNATREDGKSMLYLSDFRGLGQQHWLLSWALAMLLLSMAGIPPLAGFFGKYYLLLHALEQGMYPLVIVALATSLVSTYYYLRLIKIFWFEGDVAAEQVSCSLTPTQQIMLFTSEGLICFYLAFATLGNAAMQNLIYSALFC